MLLVEQRVEHTLPLLAHTHAPSCRAHRVNDQGLWSAGAPGPVFLEREDKIAIFTPGSGKAFIEASDAQKRITPVKTVRCQKFAVCHMRSIVLVIGGRSWQWHLD